MNEKILIQANNLDTVIDVFMFAHFHPNCTKEDVAEYCGFSLRQADYYVNACVYLGLMDKNMKLSTHGEIIFENYPAQVRECVYETIIKDELIGQIFARRYTLPDEDISEFAKEVVTDYFPGYSDAVYERRSDNIVKWCDKIIKYFSNK